LATLSLFLELKGSWVWGTEAASWVINLMIASISIEFGCLFLSIFFKWILIGKSTHGMVIQDSIWYSFTMDLVLRFREIADVILMVVYFHTPLMNVVLFLYGGRMAFSSHAASLVFNPLEADMITVDENVEISAMRLQATSVTYDGVTCTHKYGSIAIHRNAEVGFLVVIEADTIVEEGASVGFITRVPNGTIVRKNTVLYGNPGVTMKKKGMESRDVTITLSKTDWIIRNIFNVSFRFFSLIAVTLLSALVAYVCTITLDPDISDLVNSLTGEDRKNYSDSTALYLTLLLQFMIVIFGISAILITVLFKWLVMGKFVVFQVQRYDLFVQLYHSYTIVSHNFNNLVSGGANGTWFMRLLYILYGADIKLFNRTILWGTMLDQDLISMGDDVVTNDSAGMCGHNYEHAGLKWKNTRVGDHCTLYHNSLMMAGDTMLENSVLGTKSKCFGSNDPCEVGSLNVGCPARWATAVEKGESKYHKALESCGVVDLDMGYPGMDRQKANPLFANVERVPGHDYLGGDSALRTSLLAGETKKEFV